MVQKLQTVPRDSAVEAQWTKVLPDANDRGAHNFRLWISRFPYVIAAAAGLLILVLLTHPVGGAIVAFPIVAAALLPYSISCSRPHDGGRLMSMVSLELGATCLLPGNVGPTHGPLFL